MKVRSLRKSFQFVIRVERKLNIKVKPLPKTYFVGYGKGTFLKDKK
jgi:hypothetical protein